MKKIVSALIVVAFIMSAFTTNIYALVADSSENSIVMNSNIINVSNFTDISAYLPKYQNALNYIIEEKQVMNGTSSTSFSPNLAISRCDTIVTFCRVFGADITEHSNKANPFNDVPDNSYYVDYIKWAYYEGITNGTSSTQFSPLVSIQRQGLCLIFVRFCERFGVELPDNNDTTYVYSDDNSIGTYYKNAVYTLYRAGIIGSGENGNFYPEMSMIRIFFCEFLFNYYDPFVPSTPFEIRLNNVTSGTITVTWPWMRGTEYEIRINNGWWYTVRDEEYTFYNLDGATPYTISLRTKQNYDNTTLYSGIIERTITTHHRYTYNVENYFDLGYSTYYNENINSSKNAINSYMASVSDRYLDIFALRLTYSTQHYESSIDRCKGTVTSANIDTLCTHSSENHTILFDCPGCLAYEFDIPSKGKTTIAFWSCHKIQTRLDTPNEYNRSFCNGSTLYVLERAANTNRTLTSESVLMHEMNHQFGAPDHYHELINSDDMSSCKRATINNGDGYCSNTDCNKYGTIYRNSDCVMNDCRQDISSQHIICSGCKSDMLEMLEILN